MNVYEMLALLKQHGITQNQIAKFIGCSQANVSARKHSSIRPSRKFFAGLQNLIKEKNLTKEKK